MSEFIPGEDVVSAGVQRTKRPAQGISSEGASDPTGFHPAVNDGTDDVDVPVRERAFQHRRPGVPRRGRKLVAPADAEAAKTPFTPEQRLLILDSWQRSGLPAGDFAPLVGVSKHTLYAWKKQFALMGPAGLEDHPRRVPRAACPPGATAEPLRISSASARSLGIRDHLLDQGNQKKHCWPKAASSATRPLVLRLVVVQGARHPWYLVTSVGEARQLSDHDVVEIYRRRWGVELFYRHFKQTFGRRKLRSRAAEHVRCEAHWSLVGLWAMLLYAEQHLQRRRVPPRRMSVAGVLRAFRSLLKQPSVTTSSPKRFATALDAAVIDDYVRRNKSSRNYPRKKSELPCGPPKIQTATRQQKRIAKRLKRTKSGLTA